MNHFYLWACPQKWVFVNLDLFLNLCIKYVWKLFGNMIWKYDLEIIVIIFILYIYNFLINK